MTAEKCTKKGDAPAELLFTNLNLLLFSRPRCRRRRRCLSSLTQEHNCFYFIGYPILFCFCLHKGLRISFKSSCEQYSYRLAPDKKKSFVYGPFLRFGNARAVGVIKIKHENKSVATYTHVREKMLKNKSKAKQI